MKNLLRFFCGMMLVAITACTSKELLKVSEPQQYNNERLISVIAYTPNDKPVTRLAFDNNQKGDVGVSWSEGDAFTAVIDNKEITFTYDVKTGMFNASLDENTRISNGIKAYFPAYTGEFSVDLSEQNGMLDSKVTYMEGIYDESTNSFSFNHSTAILRAKLHGMDYIGEVNSVKVDAGPYKIIIDDVTNLNLSDGIFIYLPAIAKDGQVNFSMETKDNKLYASTNTVKLDDGIELGKVYDALIAFDQVICNLPTGYTFQTTLNGISGFNKVTSIKFEAKSEETGGIQIGNSLAYAKILSDGTTLKVYTIAPEFVFNSNCNDMFNGMNNIHSIEFGNDINTANVTSMGAMFKGCEKLTTLNLDKFNTEKVTNMTYMFYQCYALPQLDLSSFNTAKVTNMQYMFNDCQSLTEIILSTFNTENVTSMNNMFSNCYALSSLDLSNFKTDIVTDMQSMFRSCNTLSTLELSTFNTAAVTSMYSMFSDCEKLSSINVSGFNTENVTDMSNMFKNCISLTSLDLRSFKAPKVKRTQYMFSNCVALKTLDLSSFNTDVATSMQYMFSGCQALESLDLSKLITDNVTNMESMFSSCSALKSLDLSSFNTSAVTDMSSMFSACNALESLNLSSFNTAAVTEMQYMFDKCRALKSLDLSKFNTSSVTKMHYMFDNCNALTSLNLSNFNTAKVDNAEKMFYSCYLLESLDLSMFDTGSLTNFNYMFRYVGRDNANRPINIYVKDEDTKAKLNKPDITGIDSLHATIKVRNS